jgi:hypothetical protein
MQVVQVLVTGEATIEHGGAGCPWPSSRSLPSHHSSSESGYVTLGGGVEVGEGLFSEPSGAWACVGSFSIGHLRRVARDMNRHRALKTRVL